MKTRYTGSKSLIKQNSREKLFYMIQNHWRGYKPKNVLTLPNTEFFLEREIHKLYKGSKITGYETDPRIFKRALKYKPGFMKLINDDIFNAPDNKPYDLIWFDFCNRLHLNLINKILLFTSRVQFNPKAILIFTFSQRGTSDRSIEYSEFFTDYKHKGFANHIGAFLNRPIKEAQFLSYGNKDLNARATPMSIFVLKLQ